MTTSLEDLKILQVAEKVADEIWKHIVLWNAFTRDTVGLQLARAADSIGANIAESFGRFNYGEKVQFLYYARGSLFKTKYWLNRTKVRDLISIDLVQSFANQLTELARQMNAFVSNLKNQRRAESSEKKPRKVRELSTTYTTAVSDEWPNELFTKADLEWLITIPDANTNL
jgi:four helix bundle protein